jgi:hypothetical protein
MYSRLSIQKHTGKFLAHPSRYYFTLYFASDSSLRRAVTKRAIPAADAAAPTIPGSESLVCSVLAAVRGLWSDCPDRCFCHSTFSELTLTGHRCACVGTLDGAKSRVREFMEAWPAEYLVVSRATGQKISIKRDGCPGQNNGMALAPS